MYILYKYPLKNEKVQEDYESRRYRHTKYMSGQYADEKGTSAKAASSSTGRRL